MATLTITVPDAVVPRIRAAMGRNDPTSGERIPATVAEVQIEIKSFIRSQVINYETTLAAETKRSDLSKENWES